ncbi:MAG: hypothetical protein AAF569_08975 [Pseudomonadota bacterium]
MKNFEVFCGIDWSGAKTPIKTRAISVALAWQGNEAPHSSGKIWSRQMVADWLMAMADKGKRTLVGIDCNFGYAQEVGEAQFGSSYDYRNLWQAVEAANQNELNYFAGGYWTHKNHARYFWTEGKMRDGFTMPKRLTETTCAHDGYGVPESPFKLIGAKQVGKGGLSGMRMAYDLKQKLGDKIAIWPFEQETDDATIVMTEIYPRQFLMRTGHGTKKVRTLTELNDALSALGSEKTQDIEFSDHDADALVSAAGLRMLCGTGRMVPDNITNPPMLDRKRASREGWILGVGDK